MATLETGKNWLWKVNTGTDVSPTWTTIATQREGSFDLDHDTVDGSYKGSGGWTSTIPTLQKWAGSFSAIYDATDTAIQKLRAVALSQTKTGFKLVGQTGENWTGSAWVKIAMTVPHDDLAMCEITLLTDGAIVYAAS